MTVHLNARLKKSDALVILAALSITAFELMVSSHFNNLSGGANAISKNQSAGISSAGSLVALVGSGAWRSVPAG